MFDELLEANRGYASVFALSGLPAVAARGFALVTCMDSRIEPLTMLGLQPGDAKILRNAGARVTSDILRSLALAAAHLGVVEVAVMQHTTCALAGHDDDELRAGLPEDRGEDPRQWAMLGMVDPDAALREDVEAIRRCGLLPAGLRVQGWRYDVDTGLINRIVEG